MSVPNITECRECGGKSLTWDTHNKVARNIQDGRLRSHDVSCVFVLGCDECSETLAVVSADKIAAHLTASAKQSAPLSEATTNE